MALTEVNLAYNKFSGLLPAWNLPNLEIALLIECNFTGKAGRGGLTLLVLKKHTKVTAHLWHVFLAKSR